jgi:hypothetical protein
VSNRSSAVLYEKTMNPQACPQFAFFFRFGVRHVIASIRFKRRGMNVRTYVRYLSICLFCMGPLSGYACRNKSFCQTCAPADAAGVARVVADELCTPCVDGPTHSHAHPTHRRPFNQKRKKALKTQPFCWTDPTIKSAQWRRLSPLPRVVSPWFFTTRTDT